MFRHILCKHNSYSMFSMLQNARPLAFHLLLTAMPCLRPVLRPQFARPPRSALISALLELAGPMCGADTQGNSQPRLQGKDTPKSLAAAGGVSPPEGAWRSITGHIILVFVALSRLDVSKDVVSAVACDARWRGGVTGHVVGAWIPKMPVEMVGCNIGIPVCGPALQRSVSRGNSWRSVPQSI